MILLLKRKFHLSLIFLTYWWCHLGKILYIFSNNVKTEMIKLLWKQNLFDARSWKCIGAESGGGAGRAAAPPWKYFGPPWTTFAPPQTFILGHIAIQFQQRTVFCVEGFGSCPPLSWNSFRATVEVEANLEAYDIWTRSISNNNFTASTSGWLEVEVVEEIKFFKKVEALWWK